jgi:hypothetical protein
MEDLVLTNEADETRRKLVKGRTISTTSQARAAKHGLTRKVEWKGCHPMVKDQAASEDPLKPVETAAASVCQDSAVQLLSGTERRDEFCEFGWLHAGTTDPSRV